MSGTTTLDLTPKLIDPSPAVATPEPFELLKRNDQCIFSSTQTCDDNSLPDEAGDVDW
jgi:hypothetical protein